MFSGFRQNAAFPRIMTEISTYFPDELVGLSGCGSDSLHEQLIVFGAGALRFEPHAAKGAVVAGIYDMGVSRRQQRSFVGTAGAVPDIAADVILACSAYLLIEPKTINPGMALPTVG